MMLALRTDTAWTRLTKLARSQRRGPAVAAVPYLGAGAAQRLPLRSGDLLVTRFDDGAFKSGLVDPKEVVKYLRLKVEVHAVANLHPKVFAFGNRAIVGSTNVSNHSANHLIEAVCECDDIRFVAAATRFVKSLRGDQVGLQFAGGKVVLYKPPRIATGTRKGQRRLPAQSYLSAIKLGRIDYDSFDQEVEEKGSIDAQEMLEDPNKFTIETFRWTGDLPAGLRPGTRVMMCTKIGTARISVEAPASPFHPQIPFGARLTVHDLRRDQEMGTPSNSLGHHPPCARSRLLAKARLVP